MKISIAQNEIELAVEKYIRSMVSLATGADITIDFSATRGPEGLTASINIAPPTEEQPKAEQVDEPVTTQTVAAKPAAEAIKSKRLVVSDSKPTKEATTKVTETVVTKKAPETVSDETVVDPAPTVLEEAGDAAVVQTGGFPGFAKDKDQEPVTETETVAETVEEVVAQEPTRKSLFGNLSRPSNS